MSLKRIFIFFAAIVVAAVVAVVGIRWHAFVVEDQIHDTFLPVAMALFDYEHAHSSPATNLTQLVPTYISQLPSSRFADFVEYSVIDEGKAWQLTIRSRALFQTRLYCCRSTREFTADEQSRVVLRYHGIWTVLKEK